MSAVVISSWNCSHNVKIYGMATLDRLRRYSTKLSAKKGKERPIHPAWYRARTKAREFERHVIERMLAMDVIDHTQTESASPIVSVPKKDFKLCFSITCRKLIAVMI